MSSKFKKDKEIIAEYETQVKGAVSARGVWALSVFFHAHLCTERPIKKALMDFSSQLTAKQWQEAVFYLELCLCLHCFIDPNYECSFCFHSSN